MDLDKLKQAIISGSLDNYDSVSEFMLKCRYEAIMDRMNLMEAQLLEEQLRFENNTALLNDLFKTRSENTNVNGACQPSCTLGCSVMSTPQ